MNVLLEKHWFTLNFELTSHYWLDWALISQRVWAADWSMRRLVKTVYQESWQPCYFKRTPKANPRSSLSPLSVRLGVVGTVGELLIMRVKGLCCSYLGKHCNIFTLSLAGKRILGRAHLSWVGRQLQTNNILF